MGRAVTGGSCRCKVWEITSPFLTICDVVSTVFPFIHTEPRSMASFYACQYWSHGTSGKEQTYIIFEWSISELAREDL